MKTIIICIVVALSAIALYSCAPSGSDKAEVIDAEAFKAKMAELDNELLLDVRTPEEFKNGYIQGAINVDFKNENFKTEIMKLDNSRPVMVYCAKGGRSGMSTKILEEAGFETIYDLKGGYSDWPK